MEETFIQIKCIAEDIRLNPINTLEIKDYKLRQIEDICTHAVIILNQMRNENN